MTITEINKLTKILNETDEVIGFQIMSNEESGYCISIRFMDRAGYENSEIIYDWDFNESVLTNLFCEWA